MPKVLVLSDLHFEFHQDGGQAFVNDLADPNEVDVVILAGDIAVGTGIPGALKLFCRRYKQVLYVHGNHEFYGTTRKAVMHHTRQVEDQLPNLKWLHLHEDQPGSGPVMIDGVRFVGAPLWFPKAEGNPYRNQMNDFKVIKDFTDWVYEENEATVNFLQKEAWAYDVVITHHLPSFRSVHSMFAGSPLNDFFVCDVEHIIRSAQPKLWVHGHTHFSCDYSIGKTRVVCNPFGYARREENRQFDFGKVIEL